MNERGYTLIEMAVVILLVGILVGVSIPRVRDTVAGDSLKKASRTLIILSRELRNDAVREQVDYELHVDMDGRKLWRCPVDTTAEKRVEVRRQAFALPEGIRFRDIQLYGAGKQLRGEVVMRFSRGGYMQPAVIHLAYGEKNMTLIFGPFIPRVQVQDEYIDVWQTGAHTQGAG